MALKREMGTFSVFSMAAGAMISSGLFVLPAIAFARVGPCVFVCYLLACLLLLPSVLTKAELMTAMPKAGGPTSTWIAASGPASALSAALPTGRPWRSRALSPCWA